MPSCRRKTVGKRGGQSQRGLGIWAGPPEISVYRGSLGHSWRKEQLGQRQGLEGLRVPRQRVLSGWR